MDVRTNEQLRTRLTSLVEACRADHLRIKDAGGHVTEGERAEARAAYAQPGERPRRVAPVRAQYGSPTIGPLVPVNTTALLGSNSLILPL